MNSRYSRGVHKLFLTLALLIPLTFTVPVSAITTSQCTTTYTRVSPTSTFVRTFAYMLFGSVTGNWTLAYSYSLRGVTYDVTVATQCAPKP